MAQNSNSQRKNKIETTIGILLLAACLYHIIFNRYNWREADSQVFYFPVFIGAFLIFKKNISFLMMGILSWIAYIFAEQGLIEKELYNFILRNDYFPKAVMEFGPPNPMYMILVFFLLVITPLTVLVILPKTRSKMRTFSWISCCGSLVFTYVIHNAIPGTLLKWNRQLDINFVEDILATGKDPSAKSKLADICATFNLTCVLSENRNAVLKAIENPNANSYVSNYIDTIIERDIQTQVIEVNSSRNGSLHRQTVGLIKYSSDLFSIIIEEKWINQSQKLAEEVIGKWGLLGHFVWGWLVFFLGIFHTLPIRNRIFRNSEISK